MLHAEIYRNLFHHQSTQDRQRVLVLVTGDGNANSGQTSFPIVVETALKRDWKVEIWSWERSLSGKFLEIQRQFPAQMSINYLDPYRNAITFEEKTKQN
jgi:hypothetical protein